MRLTTEEDWAEYNSDPTAHAYNHRLNGEPIVEGCCRDGKKPENWGEMKHQQSHITQNINPIGYGSEDGDAYTSVSLPKLVFKDKPKSILAEAEEIINGDRAKAYGHPKPNHIAIASLWQAYLNNRDTLGIEGDLTPEDAALMMVLLKVARLQFLPDHRDSLVDIAGYVGCIERIVSD